VYSMYGKSTLRQAKHPTESLFYRPGRASMPQQAPTPKQSSLGIHLQSFTCKTKNSSGLLLAFEHRGLL
jgi:hypothetical protein